MKDQTKEKVMAFVVIGIIAGSAITALVVGLSKRKANPTQETSVAMQPGKNKDLLPGFFFAVPTGDAPFDNPFRSINTWRNKTEEERYALIFEYVRRHKWWKRVLKPDQLTEMVKRCIDMNQGGTLLIRQDGEVTVDGGWEGDLNNIRPSQKAGHKYIDYNALGSSRPDPRGVLMQLSRELDEAEYKEGPGR